MTAKRHWGLQATVLLGVLIASFGSLEGLPLSSSLLFDDLLYDEVTSSDEGPLYGTNDLYGLLDRHGLAEPPFPSDVFSRENENVARKLLGRRKSHGSFEFSSSRKPETDNREQNEENQDDRLSYNMPSRIAFPFRKADAGLPLYSATVDANALIPRKSSRLDRSKRMLHSLLAHLASTRKSNSGMTGSKTKRTSFRLHSSFSKRDNVAAVRSEGTVHPVYLGYGQETSGAALNTLARLLADEERLRQMNPGMRESIRFIG